MVNSSKINDPRFQKKWRESGAMGDIYGHSRGEAYAFFDCSASSEQIAEEIPYIRELVNTPKRLELYFSRSLVIPMVSQHTLDSELLGIASDAKEASLKYVIAARATPNMSNRQVADELAAVVNQAYQSPLYQDGEGFRGGIFYKENDHYVSRD
ncbi:MAG: hypothetical protein WCI72_05030 [archaeon]